MTQRGVGCARRALKEGYDVARGVRDAVLRPGQCAVVVDVGGAQAVLTSDLARRARAQKGAAGLAWGQGSDGEQLE